MALTSLDKDNVNRLMESLSITKINDDKLYKAECNFSKVFGHIYHFYERENGSIFCSMIGPNEWSLYHKYYGSFLYDFDSEFKII